MASDVKVGHEVLDAQHLVILGALAEVDRAVAVGDAAASVEALRHVWDEMVSHFATEESLMELHGYPERAGHRSSHQLFLEDLKGLIAAVQADGLSPENVVWASERVPQWVTFHMETNDVPLGRFLGRRIAARAIAAAQGLPQPPKRSDA